MLNNRGGDNTKTARVLKHLLSGKSITSWEAIQEYRVTRLASIIFSLKKKGYPIKTRYFTDHNGVNIAEYWIEVRGAEESA